MTLAEATRMRGIREVVHFTTNRGMVGILARNAILSRRRLPQDKYLQYILYPNAAMRPEESPYFDKAADWLDYVNLSISDINSRFFAVSQRWHRDQDIWWVIASCDPVVILHEGVNFATTNNKYALCTRSPGRVGFDALFSPVIGRQPGWYVTRTVNRPTNLPTCEQAEVLYPAEVPGEYLRSVYVREGPDCDRVRAWLREFGRQDVQVVIDPLKFEGVPN